MDEHRKYGLLEMDLNRIISIFKSNQKVEKTILFGSRAKGNFQPGSDIDIVLQGTNLKLDDILDFKIKIEELLLPYKFDITIYERIKNQELLDHIDRVGVLLFQRSLGLRIK